MRIDIIAFTPRGVTLARKLQNAFLLDGHTTTLSGPHVNEEAPGSRAYGGLAAWTRDAFEEADALVFVSACGIAVRAIAAHLRDKYTDPAVVCVDEAGRFAVSLLSGHVGGANRLARRVAEVSGGQAVITTATDVNGAFAVDEWATRQNLVVCEREGAKELASALLAGERIGFESDLPLMGPLPQGLVAGEAARACRRGILVAFDARRRVFGQTLHLVPRTVTVGMGCRRGTSAETLEALLDRCLEEARLPRAAVARIASIDLKADEAGLCQLAAQHAWSLRLHSAEELAAVPGSFSSSAFVRQAVGVDNVCERAACAGGERLLLGKRSAQGVTVALAATIPELVFEGGAR